jgi:PAS domain S-box-containing protein
MTGMDIIMKDEKYWEARLEKSRIRNNTLRSQLSTLKKEHKALQKEIKRHLDLLDAFPTGFILVQDGKIIHANKTALKMLGYLRDSVMDHPFFDFIHPVSQKTIQDLLAKWTTGKVPPLIYETLLRKPNEEVLSCEIMAQKVRIGGRAAFLFNLIPSNERLKKERLKTHREKMEAMLSMASRLARYFSLHLKTIGASVSAIRAKLPENHTIHESMNKISEASEEILKTSAKLDRLSRPESETGATKRFDLKETAKDAIRSVLPRLKQQADERGVTINVRTYLRAVAPIEGIQKDIQDVIVHMILNAVDAMPEGGDLYLTTEENGNHAYIYIQDTGIGIPEQIEERILDPFFTTKGECSAGLGMSLSYAILQRHMGEIEVTGREGQGASIAIKLPLAAPTKPANLKAPWKARRNAQVLLVHENALVRELLCQTMESRGPRVVKATNGAEGLHHLRKRNYDLVVVDSGLSDMTIRTFLKEARNTNKARAIALLSHPGETERADLFIPTPLNMSGIEKQLIDFLSGHKASI